MVVLYCDLPVSQCINRGLPLTNGAGQIIAQTNEGEWWKALNHDTATDGAVVVRLRPILPEGAGVPAISRTVATIPMAPVVPPGAEGSDTNFMVAAGANPALPMTVPIDLVVDPSQPNYTDRWLVYNKDFNLMPASPAPNPPVTIPFYRVRFIGNAQWTGIGNTGNVIGNGGAPKKTHRLDW
jgi:hypothetical protein